MERIKSVTTIHVDHVLYEVYRGDVLKWSLVVKFGRDARHRAGGFAFREAALAQEQAAHREENEG